MIEFEWTSNGSAAYDRAAISSAEMKTTHISNEAPSSSVAEGSRVNGDAASDARAQAAADGGGRAANRQAKGDRGGGREDREPVAAGASKKLRIGLPAKLAASRILPHGSFGQTAEGKGGDLRMQRRGTHAGVIESGERGLGLKMLHFTSEAFMDPDTAAQVRVPAMDFSVRKLERTAVH